MNISAPINDTDLDDKRRLARRIAAQNIAKKKASGGRNPIGDLASGVNKTLISAVTAIPDISSQVMGAVTGQEPYSFNKKAEAIAGDAGLVNQGLDESRAERIGKIGGTAVLGVGAIGSLAKATSLVAPILQGFRAAPKTFAATETIAAGGSAIGGEIGRTYGETEELIGQVVGGITAPFTLSTAAKMPTFRLLRKAQKVAGRMLLAGLLKTLSLIKRLLSIWLMMLICFPVRN